MTAKSLKIENCTDIEAFVILKDHTSRFPLNIECRLLNPGKNHIGKISKVILEKIVKQVRLQTPLIQWKKNSSEVINWFDEIEKMLYNFWYWEVLPQY